MGDADMENTETQISLDFMKSCEYISEKRYNEILAKLEETGRMLNHMIENPEKYKPRQWRDTTRL